MDASADTAWSTNPAFGDELAPGTSLCQGQYTVVRYLNSGGFGVTYIAHDSLGRKVVIKECYPGAICCRTAGTVRLRSRSHDMDFDRVVTLFEREALALAQLQHPNIVGVHQIFKDNGTAYMAMDFVEGPDLFDLLESRPDVLDPNVISEILNQLLKALSYVHANNILHRDISPDNILLAPGQTPVLIDFGAAREDAKRATRILSRIHTVKDGYSPQEFYLAGGTQDKSSDLYALAATIHHLIVGNPPPNSNFRLAAVAQREPDPYITLKGRVSGYDDRFLSAIDTCLSLFGKDRLPDAETWMDMISANPRKVNLPGDITISDDIKRRIAQIVTETSSFIEQADAASPKPRADVMVATQGKTNKDAAERAYWAILNEDPDEIRREVARGKKKERRTFASKRPQQEPEAPVSVSAVAAQPDPPQVPRPPVDDRPSGGLGSRFFSFLSGRRSVNAPSQYSQ